MVERKREEFWCDTGGGGCGLYFKTYLRENMSGIYTIECPNCKHHHFRKIVKGLVTSDRDYAAQNQKQILVGLAATLSKTPWHNDPAFKRSLMKSL